MTDNKIVEVSIIFPVYNEADKIESAVIQTIAKLEQYSKQYEIIIAEDGSNDGTDKLAALLTNKYPQIRHLHSNERLGRGKALNRAIKQANGSVVVYMDIDLATEIYYLDSLIENINQGWDLVTGSRLHSESVVTRSKIRNTTSRIYNKFVSFLLKTGVSDHQCGFKAFNREKILQILDEVEDSHWFWDTEILAIASRRSLRVKEIPIVWREGASSKVDLVHDSISMGLKVVSLWLRLYFKG